MVDYGKLQRIVWKVKGILDDVVAYQFFDPRGGHGGIPPAASLPIRPCAYHMVPYTHIYQKFSKVGYLDFPYIFFEIF